MYSYLIVNQIGFVSKKFTSIFYTFYLIVTLIIFIAINRKRLLKTRFKWGDKLFYSMFIILLRKYKRMYLLKSISNRRINFNFAVTMRTT